MSSGTIQVRRPRVRDLEERFESRVLPRFAKRTRQVRELIPELYLHGLALGDFDLALRGLLGDKAPLSASTVARLKEKWQAEWEVWQSRPLDDLDGDLLQLSEEAVAASANHQSSGVTVCRSSAANGRGQAIQESGKHPGFNLEDAAGGGEAIPPVEGTGADERRLPGRRICQWSPGQPSPGGESRLMFLHTY